MLQTKCPCEQGPYVEKQEWKRHALHLFVLCKEENESCFKVLLKYKLSPVCALNIKKNGKVVGEGGGGGGKTQLLIGTVSAVSFRLTDGDWKETSAIGTLASSLFNTFEGCQEAEFK